MDNKEKNILIYQVVMGITPLLYGLLKLHEETKALRGIDPLMMVQPHDIAAEFGVAAFAMFCAGLIFGSALDGYMRWKAGYKKQQSDK